jgi:hypothetical protein
MVQYTKKDMMARTKGPPMRVQVMKIRRKAEDIGEDIISPIPVAED